MTKKFNLSFFIKIVFYSKYLPSIIFKIKNWPLFILNYIGARDGEFECQFRNGIRIRADDNTGAAIIAVIFIKKDYGNISDNSVVIDIGANIGVFSIFAAQSKNTVVYAYEPASGNFNLLKENISLNKLNKLGNKVFPFNLAVSAKKEKRKLYLGESPFHSFLSVKESPFNVLYNNIKEGPKQKYSEINCVSLKNIFDENKIDFCDVLKIDCEGAEYEILYNLPDNYFRKIKEIRLEYHNHLNNKKNTGESLRIFLEEKGFSVLKNKKGSNFQGDLWFKNRELCN